MNAPAGMRPLSAIVADIKNWLKKNTTGIIGAEPLYRHTSCGNIIKQVTLYASLHDSPFKGCAGGGEVKNLALPYCPTCEPDVPAATQRTCIHENRRLLA